MTETKNIYVLYAASDSAALRFIDRLKAFEKRYKITIWDDDPIQQNLVWRPQETTRLERADLFVLLLSKNFMYSEFVQQLEFKQVIDRYKVGASKIVPVVLDDCPWDTNFESDDYNFSFKELQVLPEGGKPLTQWDSEDEALKIVLPKVEEAISSIAQPIEEKKPLQEQKKEAAGIPLKDQLALDFEKQAEAKRQAEEENGFEKRKSRKKKPKKNYSGKLKFDKRQPSRRNCRKRPRKEE